MHVYAYMHVYMLKRYYIYAKILDHVHCYTVQEVIPIYCEDGCSRPENANGILHYFEHLFASTFQGTDFLGRQRRFLVLP